MNRFDTWVYGLWTRLRPHQHDWKIVKTTVAAPGEGGDAYWVDRGGDARQRFLTGETSYLLMCESCKALITRTLPGIEAVEKKPPPLHMIRGERGPFK